MRVDLTVAGQKLTDPHAGRQFQVSSEVNETMTSMISRIQVRTAGKFLKATGIETETDQ